MNFNIWIILLLAPVSFVLFILFDRFTQSPTDFEDRIVNELKKSGNELISLRLPKILDTGPFPLISFTPFYSSSDFGSLQGTKTRYRIVEYKSKGDIVKESWIKIEVKERSVLKITWIPEL